MRHIEETIQETCVRWFEYQYPKLRLLLHHSPNGGRRNAREGARFKAMGTRAGFPDLFLSVARHEFHGLYIEMKAPNGTLRQSQKEFQQAATQQGYLYVVCRSLDSFMDTVNWYLKEETSC